MHTSVCSCSFFRYTWTTKIESILSLKPLQKRKIIFTNSCSEAIFTYKEMANDQVFFYQGLRRKRFDNFILNAGHFHGVVLIFFFFKGAAVTLQRCVLVCVQLIREFDVVTWQVVNNSRAKGVTHDIDACAETIPKKTKLMCLTILFIQPLANFFLSIASNRSLLSTLCVHQIMLRMTTTKI